MSELLMQTYHESTMRQQLAAGRILKYNALFFESLGQVHENLANWDSYLLVDEGRTVAAAAMKLRRSGRASLEYLAVKQKRQGHGIGEKFMGLLEGVALDRSVGNGVLISLVPLLGSEGFYEKQGYSVDMSKSGEHTKFIRPHVL